VILGMLIGLAVVFLISFAGAKHKQKTQHHRPEQSVQDQTPGFMATESLLLQRGAELQNCFVDLDDGQIVSAPKELIPLFHQFAALSLEHPGLLNIQNWRPNGQVLQAIEKIIVENSEISTIQEWLRSKGIDLFLIHDRLFFNDASVVPVPEDPNKPQPFQQPNSQEVLLRAANQSRHIDSDRPPAHIPLIYELSDDQRTAIFQSCYGHTGLIHRVEPNQNSDAIEIQYKLVGRDPSLPYPNSDPYSVQLNNGIEVELLGICEYPSEGQSWWDPHGNILKESPYDDGFAKAFPKKGEKGYKLALRIGNIAGREIGLDLNPMSFGTTNGGGLSEPSEKNGQQNVTTIADRIDEVIIWQGVAIAAGRENCHISIGVCFGNWKQEYWHRYKIDPTNKAVEWHIFRNVALKPKTEYR
jgi:hypothetical protein